MINKNLFPDSNEKSRLKYIQLSRLDSNLDYFIKKEQVTEALEKCFIIKDIDKNIASFGFKRIANCFLKLNNNKKAFENFKLTLELNPSIVGIDKKIQKLSKELFLNYDIDENFIIRHLENTKNALPKGDYQLRYIAERYYSIKLYEKSIDLYKQLLLIRGEENPLLEGITKAYKAIGKEQEKTQNYNVALNFYMLSYKLIEKLKFPTKKLEKEKILITNKINEMQILLKKES